MLDYWRNEDKNIVFGYDPERLRYYLYDYEGNEFNIRKDDARGLAEALEHNINVW